MVCSVHDPPRRNVIFGGRHFVLGGDVSAITRPRACCSADHGHRVAAVSLSSASHDTTIDDTPTAMCQFELFTTQFSVGGGYTASSPARPSVRRCPFIARVSLLLVSENELTSFSLPLCFAMSAVHQSPPPDVPFARPRGPRCSSYFRCGSPHLRTTAGHQVMPHAHAATCEPPCATFSCTQFSGGGMRACQVDSYPLPSLAALAHHHFACIGAPRRTTSTSAVDGLELNSLLVVLATTTTHVGACRCLVLVGVVGYSSGCIIGFHKAPTDAVWISVRDRLVMLISPSSPIP